MSRSDISSTRGETSFDSLLRGAETNACDNLILLKSDDDIPQPLPVCKAVYNLISHIENLLSDLNFLTIEDFVLKTFEIGKTTVGQRRKPGGGWKSFNPMQANTWNLGSNGPNKRWQRTYRSDGYCGLVALCAVTRDMVPPNTMFMDQQQYTLLLESNLIQYYAFERRDCRLGNKSLLQGRLASNDKTYAGVLYVAYKMEQVPDRIQV